MTVYFQCPKPETPSGGVLFIHQIVRLLREMGKEAFVWTPKPFQVWWSAYPFDPSMIVQSIQPGRGDIVVLPEVSWPAADMNGARQVIFVQNYVWLSQEGFRNNPTDVLVCSRFLANHMVRVFNANVVGKITPFLEEGVWEPTPKELSRTLVFARRNPYHAKMRDALEASGFPVEYVTESLTQGQLAILLKRCEFYVHLSHPEGFPIAWLEAMRSGTIVVGTTGGGGNEIATTRETGMVVQDPENGRYNDQDEFIRRIMEAMNELRADADMRSRIWHAALDWSFRYTAEATKLELKEIFG